MNRALPVLAFSLAALAAAPSPAQAQYAPYPPPPPVYVERPPSTGIGLIVTGSVFTGIGVVNLVTAPICKTSAIAQSTQSLCLDASLVLAGITLAIGVPMLAVGVVRHNAYVEWKKSNSLAARLTDLGIAPVPGGGVLGWRTAF
jgi:hypothetical protein